jgi:hypothetical protein
MLESTPALEKNSSSNQYLELPLASGATALGSVKQLHTDPLLEAVVEGLNEIIGF